MLSNILMKIKRHPNIITFSIKFSLAKNKFFNKAKEISYDVLLKRSCEFPKFQIKQLLKYLPPTPPVMSQY